MTSTAKTTGREGEETAARFLEEKGFEIVDRNYRFRKYGEIDLIARKDKLLAFVEVKTRRADSFGGPLYSITPRKKRTIRFIANQYLASHPESFSRDIVCRFDMIAIVDSRIDWIEDIFR